MKTCNLFLILALIGNLNLSCHSSKNEVRNEQSVHPQVAVSSALDEKNVRQDSISPSLLRTYTQNMNDTAVGTVYIAGNEPFTHISLSLTSTTQYLVEADSSLKTQLWQLQGKKVRIIGIKKTSLLGTSIQAKFFQLSP